MKINASIIGASGYTGMEMIRLLIGHPHAELAYITSREHAGKKIGDVIPRFSESQLKFSAPDIDEIKSRSDVVFLCLPHGLATEFAIPLIENKVRTIDVSADFRLKDPELYKQFYDLDHPAPELLAQSVYGLPEKNRDKLKSASIIACPGCYPTSIILPVFPLLEQGLVLPSNIFIASMSGVTGAGRKATIPLLFAECNESIRAYSTTGHRHLPEIKQELSDSHGKGKVTLNFVPHLAPLNRGLLSTIFLKVADPAVTRDDISRVYHDYYENERFVRVLPYGESPDTKNVIYTNYCEIGFNYDADNNVLIVNSAIDNLTKGAAGQAIQCMNICFDYDETAGLIN